MEHVNEVRLVGRVSAVGEARELPSGDVVQTLRVVVPREPPPRRRGAAAGEGERASPGVDTIDVACWTAASRRTARSLAIDDSVEVVGSLRRRFFRAGGSVASRYEVEARTLRKVKVTAAAG